MMGIGPDRTDLIITPRQSEKDKRSGSQGPQSANKAVPTGNQIHLSAVNVDQLSAEALSNPAIVG